MDKGTIGMGGHYLYAFLLLVAMQLRLSKAGTVCQGHDEKGKMWQIGIKNQGTMDQKYYNATKECVCNDIPLLPWVNMYMSNL